MCRLVIYKVLLLSSLEGYCSFERKIKILKNVHMEKEHWLKKISLWPQIREIMRIKFLIKFFAKTLSIYLFFIFLQNYKMIIKSFECPKYIRKYENKILKMSDAWSTSRLSHRSSKPVYYIVDWRISKLNLSSWRKSLLFSQMMFLPKVRNKIKN